MDEKIEDIFKKVAATGNLSSNDCEALVHELTTASELLEHIATYVPQHYSEFIVLPRHMKAFREMGSSLKRWHHVNMNTSLSAHSLATW